jgi:sugar (pentulose or hexulose) kinase
MTADKVGRDTPPGSDSLLMVLDAGGGGGRCLLIDTTGREVSFAYRPWTMKTPEDNPMASVFDPDEWWEALVDASREALAKATDGRAAGGRPLGAAAVGRRVLAISTTSLRDAAVFIDGGGQELYCGTNRDARAIGLGFEIAQNLGETHWHITTRWPLGLDPAARLLWFKQTDAALFGRVRHILMVNSWLAYRLTGVASAEPTNASSSGLFDVEKGVWSPELAAAHGFDAGLLPPLLWPGQVVGGLAPQAAEALGLPPDIPVVAGPADSQAGCLGSGAWAPGDTTVIAGTTLPVMQVTDRPFRDPSHRIWMGAYVAPGRWVVESNGGMAGSVYAWCASTFGGGSGVYDVLENEIEAAPPAQVQAWLGPQVANFSSIPFPGEATIKFPALGVFCTPSRGALARAVLENIAYAVKGNIEQLPEKPALVRVCGGLSRSPAFVRLLAAVLDIPVVAPRVREATGTGAAIAAAVGAGVYPDLAKAMKAMVAFEEPCRPDPALTGPYEAGYATWRAGCPG